MWPNLHETADLVKFTEEILNEKFHFLYSVLIDASKIVLIRVDEHSENTSNIIPRGLRLETWSFLSIFGKY